MSTSEKVTRSTKKVMNTSQETTSTSHEEASTSYEGTSTSHERASTSHERASTSYKETTTSHEKASRRTSKKVPASSLQVVQEEKENIHLEENEELEENDVSINLLKVCKQRSKMPNRLKRIEARILKRELVKAEQVKILPGPMTRKVACKYSLREPIPEELKVPQPKHNPAELLTRAKKLLEKQSSGLEKAMEERLNKVKK